MRIIIRPSDAEDAVAVYRELQKALAVLHAAYIFTFGGGSVIAGGDSHGVIMLQRETDLATALDALTKAGIRAMQW